MKLSSITLAAAALALAGSAAMAQTTVNRTVEVGPNGEVTHVTKRVDTPNGVTTIHRTRRVTTTTEPVIVHRHVVYHSPYWYHHHDRVAYVEPHYRHHGDYVVERHVVHHEVHHYDNNG